MSNYANTVYHDTSLQTVRINDFSAGIVQYGLGTQGATLAPFAPLGSAQNSFRCIFEPGVGLVPLPTYSLRQQVSHTAALQSSPALPFYVTALKVMGGFSLRPAIQNIVDTVFIAIDFQSSATQRTSEWWRYEEYISAVSTTLLHSNTFTVTNQSWGTNFAITRTLYTHTDATVIAFPIVWFSSFIESGVYGSPSGAVGGTTTDLTPLLPIPTTTFTPRYAAACFAHEFRVVVLVENAYGLGTKGAQQQFLNEDLIYFDPPEGSAFVDITGIPLPHFDPEDISGWGAWGSVNSGELFMVRQGRGAVIINGDISTPDVTKLPGVRGTGKMIGEAVVTPNGFIYLAESDGAWVWNGSNTSTKISDRIPDNALQRAAVTANGLVGPNAQNDCWGNWAVFANNWLYDTVRNNWWKIEDSSIVTFELFARGGWNDRHLWACQGQATPPALPNLYLFDRNTQASSWFWQSNPLTPYVGAYTGIEVVEIMASNTSATSCTFTVVCSSLSSNDQNSIVFTIPANSIGIRRSARVGYKHDGPMISVTAANSNTSNPAPTLHEIAVGYSPELSPTGLT